MTKNKKPEYTRRQVIKKVMIGGVIATVVLPGKWTRPIIETVITPAHAAASAPATTATSTTPTSTTQSPTTQTSTTQTSTTQTSTTQTTVTTTVTTTIPPTTTPT